ncbi:MAG: hypothetical protein K9H49_13840 [Bacteroidales bacterium]|nr:hypothetical protein [Bacteroidales bacterium]MCF8390252.1 hypothetical protein [Bacteroidales bacterium]
MFNIKNIKLNTQLNVKNILGWKTKRKIIVFAVDDYGNVRVDSKKARDKMDQAGLEVQLRFDAFDSLENREDLEMLFETLNSVKDKNGMHAKFTAFAIPCNIDFERMESENYQSYHYELLPETYERLSEKYFKAYSGTWELWKEGISKEFLIPQFHGREHINLKVLKEKLEKKDHEVLTALKNRSYTSISTTGYPTINWSAAFDFWDFKETSEFEPIIVDGLNAFEKVFGFRSTYFNAPGRPEHKIIHQTLAENGIKYLDTPFIKSEHQGMNKFKKELNYIGKRNSKGICYNVRNVVFEPTEEKGIDWVNYTLKQIEYAFRWNHPAVISSHRVNFCGNISPKNREIGIGSLKNLLQEITKKWPDVEFMSSVELMGLVTNSQNKKSQ